MGTPLAPYGLAGDKLLDPEGDLFHVKHIHPVTRGDCVTTVLVPVILKVKVIVELFLNVKTVKDGKAETLARIILDLIEGPEELETPRRGSYDDGHVKSIALIEGGTEEVPTDVLRAFNRSEGLLDDTHARVRMQNHMATDLLGEGAEIQTVDLFGVGEEFIEVHFCYSIA
jgi:hypothetical protein